MNRILLTDDAMHYDVVKVSKIRKKGKTINTSSEQPSKKSKNSISQSIDDIVKFYQEEKESGLISEKKLKKKIIEKMAEKWIVFKDINKF